MKNSAIGTLDRNILAILPPRQPTPLWPPRFLHLVSESEIADLRQALLRGAIPVDFEHKLNRLAKGNIIQQYVAKHCVDFIGLLFAAQDGGFRKASRADLDRLVRVLAYVRKDEDAIPDYRADGLVDDQQEVRAVLAELGPLLHSFKAWHLCHQVPTLWAN